MATSKKMQNKKAELIKKKVKSKSTIKSKLVKKIKAKVKSVTKHFIHSSTTIHADNHITFGRSRRFGSGNESRKDQAHQLAHEKRRKDNINKGAIVVSVSKNDAPKYGASVRKDEMAATIIRCKNENMTNAETFLCLAIDDKTEEEHLHLKLNIAPLHSAKLIRSSCKKLSLFGFLQLQLWVLNKISVPVISAS